MSDVGAVTIVWPLFFTVVALSAIETCCAVGMFTMYVFVVVTMPVATAIVGTGIGSDEVVEAFVALTFTFVDTFISPNDDEVDDDDVDVNIDDDADDGDDGEADVGNDAVIDFFCSFVACALEPVLGAVDWRDGTAAKHKYRPRSSVDTLVSTKNFPVCNGKYIFLSIKSSS